VRKIAVFDTNVLFSATGWKGTPFLCLELARAGIVDGVTCREIVDAFVEKLEAKLFFTAEQSMENVADLLTFLRVVSIAGQLKAIPTDPDDDKVLECAVTVGATHIVTGDRRHLLPLGTFEGITILTAAQFLDVANV
jgi:putative PIN family toxin of toxin-antitoxin system